MTKEEEQHEKACVVWKGGEVAGGHGVEEMNSPIKKGMNNK